MNVSNDGSMDIRGKALYDTVVGLGDLWDLQLVGKAGGVFVEVVLRGLWEGHVWIQTLFV